MSTEKRLSLSDKNPDPVLVIGSIAFDDIETPKGSSGRVLGGAASYGAFSSNFFAQPQMLGIVGSDFSSEFKKRFESKGIDIQSVTEDPSGPTFYWKGKYHENFESRETLEVALNVFENFRPELSPAQQKLPFVMLGNISPKLQLHVLEQLKNPHFVIADTINLWIESQHQDLLELISKVHAFVLNDEESVLLTDEPNLILAGQKLQKMGPKTVIIKKGEHGVYLFHENEIFALPAYPVQSVKDPTGAGDSFAGAFIGYLAATGKTNFRTLKAALTYATVLASITIEDFGTQGLERTTPEEIEKRKEALMRMISL